SQPPRRRQARPQPRGMPNHLRVPRGRHRHQAQVMAKRRAKLTPKKLAEFLDRLSQNGNVTVSAETCNLARRTLYDLRSSDPEFAQAWDDAMVMAADYLEQEARRRAVEGWDEPVFYQG